MPVSNEVVHDVLCVGFGPAGIALAAAMEDEHESHNGRFAARFLEAEAAPNWQPGLLIRGADINHHFLRDLATPRNPRSRFTFANYLKEQGRLFRFGHLGGPVGRLEWADYVRWVARQLSHWVDYLQPVKSIEAVDTSEGTLLRIQACDTYLARSLVLSTGRHPFIPEPFDSLVGERIFHSAEFLPRSVAFDRSSPLRIGVLGSGQSAGEIILELHRRLPRASIHSVHRGLGFRLFDTGHFSNETFFPEHADYFFSLDAAGRKQVAAETYGTNYSAIDWDLSRALYWALYEDDVQQTRRVHVYLRSVVELLEGGSNDVRLGLRERHRGTTSTLSVDYLILCTGYEEHLFHPLLEPLRPWIVVDDEGGPVVSADYRVATTEGFEPHLYLNGVTERTHGISDSTSFSMMAIKAEKVLRAVGGESQCGHDSGVGALGGKQ